MLFKKNILSKITTNQNDRVISKFVSVFGFKKYLVEIAILNKFLAKIHRPNSRCNHLIDC